MLIGRKIGTGNRIGYVDPALLLFHNHFDGTDGATSSTDQIGGVTWTLTTGSAELDTGQKKYGTASLRLPGSANTYAFTNSLSGFTSTDSFTIDGWVAFFGSDGGSGQVKDSTSGSQFACLINQNGASSSIVVDGTSSGCTINLSTWYHFAFVHDSVAQTLSGYLEGNRISQKTSYSPTSWSTVYLAHVFFSTEDVQFDEVRMYTSVGYSGATYTIPSGPF